MVTSASRRRSGALKVAVSYFNPRRLIVVSCSLRADRLKKYGLQQFHKFLVDNIVSDTNPDGKYALCAVSLFACVALELTSAVHN